MLSQLKISYEPEKSFDWIDKRYYDQYIEQGSIIIENHGGYHYADKGRGKYVQENDIYKKEQALKNGINHYIVVAA